MPVNVDELKKLSGKTVTIVTRTRVDLLGGKKNPMKGRVTKVTSSEVDLGSAGEYGRRMVETGVYESLADVKPASWGTRQGDTCIFEHKGNLYVEYLPSDTRKSTYYLDDEVIDYEKIEGTKAPRPKSDKVEYRKIKLESVVSVSAADIILG